MIVPSRKSAREKHGELVAAAGQRQYDKRLGWPIRDRGLLGHDSFQDEQSGAWLCRAMYRLQDVGPTGLGLSPGRPRSGGGETRGGGCAAMSRGVGDCLGLGGLGLRAGWEADVRGQR